MQNKCLPKRTTALIKQVNGHIFIAHNVTYCIIIEKYIIKPHFSPKFIGDSVFRAQNRTRSVDLLEITVNFIIST